jgi:hypothetical protein
MSLLQVLHGALVGGPDANDNWTDDRGNFQVRFLYTLIVSNVECPKGEEKTLKNT